MLAGDTEQAAENEEWVQVGNYPTLQDAYDHGLVVLAMGEACRVTPAETPGEFELHAEVAPAPRVAEELDVYGQEMAAARPVRPTVSDWGRHSPGVVYCILWALTLVAVFLWQGQDPWVAKIGASSNIGLLDRGEWWRPITAMFLHADVPHLAGNIGSGTLFAAMVSKVVGSWRGWIAIFVCGALGNVVTAWMHYPEPYISLGASTAVFAALGILSGRGGAEMLRQRGNGVSITRIAAPLIGGFVLLGWLGGGQGSPNTDVMGHVFGFGSGVIAGAALELVLGENTNADA